MAEIVVGHEGVVGHARGHDEGGEVICDGPSAGAVPVPDMSARRRRVGILRHRHRHCHHGSNRLRPSRQHVQQWRRTLAQNRPSDLPVDIRHRSRSCIVKACRSITKAACSSSSPENSWAEKSQVPTASATTPSRSGLISMRLSED